LLVWLLRLFAVFLCALWLLWSGVLLQRHLPGYGPMGRVGLRPRLGRPSIRLGRRRKLSRRRRRGCGAWILGRECSKQSSRFPFQRRTSQRGPRGSGAKQCSARDSRNSLARTGFARCSKRRWIPRRRWWIPRRRWTRRWRRTALIFSCQAFRQLAQHAAEHASFAALLLLRHYRSAYCSSASRQPKPRRSLA
jgi:hypothetical protein